MSMFRKKPVVIEAWRWTPGDMGDYSTENAFFRFMRQEPRPTWRVEGIGEKCVILIETLEGEMRVSPGDWIIRGVQGEFYPCKPDIFEATYDTQPAEEALS